jgi:hypothetical protein
MKDIEIQSDYVVSEREMQFIKNKEKIIEMTII